MARGPGLNLEDAMVQLEEIMARHVASPEHREAVLDMAEMGAKWARGVAQSELTHSKEHATRRGYVNHPGDYVNSIAGEAIFRNGKWDGRVIARDWKARWIEDGTKKWPKHAILRRSAGVLGDSDPAIKLGKSGE